MATRGGGLQAGGLAAVAGVDEEDPLDAAVTTGAEIIEEAKQPRSYGELARETSKMSRDKALERLQRGYDQIAAQKFDKTQKWLAAAQGFLSPTRTGGFGESLGAVAGNLQPVVQAEQAFEGNRADRLAELEAQMGRAEEDYAEREIDILGEEERGRRSSRSKTSFNTYIQDPNNPNEEILVRAQVDPDAEGGMRILELPEEYGGGTARMPDSLDPVIRGLISQSVTLGKLDPTDIDAQIDKARVAKERLATTYWGLDLIKKIRKEGGTGGIQNYIQQIREFFGSEAEDVRDRGQLMALMGDQLFAALDSFGTQINEKELMTAKNELAAGATRSTAVNESVLQQLAQKLEDTVMATKTLAGQGSARQQSAANMPLVDYGLSEEMRTRGEQLGLQFRPYIPFDQEDVVEIQSRPPMVHTPQTNAEVNAMLRDREAYDLRSGDTIQLPDGTQKRVP